MGANKGWGFCYAEDMWLLPSSPFFPPPLLPSPPPSPSFPASFLPVLSSLSPLPSLPPYPSLLFLLLCSWLVKRGLPGGVSREGRGTDGVDCLCSPSTGLNWLLEEEEGAATLIAGRVQGEREFVVLTCTAPVYTEQLLHLDVEAVRWTEESRACVHPVAGLWEPVCLWCAALASVCWCGLF